MYKSYDQLGAQTEPNRDLFDVLELANTQHKNHILSSHRIVCIDIYADWCGPCKQTAPSYSLIASTYNKPGHCAIVKYNLEKMHPSEKAKVHGIPVFEFYVDGKQVDEIVGADIPQVEEKIKNLLQGIGHVKLGKVQDNTKGPGFNRSSIRNNRSHMPQMDSVKGEPYQEGSGNYHQPYQGQPIYHQPELTSQTPGPQIRYQ